MSVRSTPLRCHTVPLGVPGGLCPPAADGCAASPGASAAKHGHGELVPCSAAGPEHHPAAGAALLPLKRGECSRIQERCLYVPPAGCRVGKGSVPLVKSRAMAVVLLELD